MNIFLDLIGSVFVRGSMVAVMLTLTVTMNDALYQRTQHANTKEHVRVIADVAYQDLTQAGYNHTGDHVFCYLYAQDVRFHGDVDDNGTSDRVRYYAVLHGATGYWTLYREVQYQATITLAKKLKSVQFQYYDSKGKITADPLKVAAVRMTFTEDVEGVTEGFTTATKDFKIYPSNL
ncbi:MAG: hypothetical protein FJ217_16975 [Ignavibacteria bacterium]|nr:hypothetical protein [Ignavibacteria bacterium]